jgi:hypothetical protein
MHASISEADVMVEREKEFERWLLQALEHGRAQLGVRSFTSLAVGQPPDGLDGPHRSEMDRVMVPERSAK